MLLKRGCLVCVVLLVGLFGFFMWVLLVQVYAVCIDGWALWVRGVLVCVIDVFTDLLVYLAGFYTAINDIGLSLDFGSILLC